MKTQRRRQPRLISFYDFNEKPFKSFDFNTPQYTIRREEIRYQNKNGFIFPLLSFYGNRSFDLQNKNACKNQDLMLKSNAQYQFYINYFQNQFQINNKKKIKPMECKKTESILKNDDLNNEDNDDVEILNQDNIKENENKNDDQITNFFDLKIDDFDEDDNNPDEFDYMNDFLEM